MNVKRLISTVCAFAMAATLFALPDAADIKASAVTVKNIDGKEVEIDELNTCTDGYPHRTYDTYEKPVMRIPATCTQDGYEVYRCGDCGRLYWTIKWLSLGHDWEYTGEVHPATYTSEGYRVRVCKVCGVVDHDVFAGKLDPSQENPGEETGGENGGEGGTEQHNQGDPNPGGDHEHNYIKKVLREATCKDEGSVEYTCSICGAGYMESPARLSTHSFDNWKTVRAATCSALGSEEHTCTVCGLTESRELEKTAHTFTSKVVKPTYKAKGYTLYTCTVCGYSYKDNYTDKLKKNDISRAEVAGIKNKYYTGKAIKQSVTVKLEGKTLKESADYSVSYKNNKAVGTATVTISGKGDYVGSIVKTFKICPKKTAIKKLTSLKTKQLKVTYGKVSGVTGYQISYSTSAKFTKKTTKTAASKTTSKTVSKLTKGKTYYVRVRTYKTIKGVNYYSGWSNVKKIKVK